MTFDNMLVSPRKSLTFEKQKSHMWEEEKKNAQKKGIKAIKGTGQKQNRYFDLDYRFSAF